MAFHIDEIYFDSNHDESDDTEEIYHDSSEDEILYGGNNVSNDNSENNGEPINSGFIDLIGTHMGVTGIMDILCRYRDVFLVNSITYLTTSRTTTI